MRLKTKSCGSRIYDHEDEKCVDASSEKRQDICYAPDRQFCANTTTAAWSTATSTATTSTTSTMMSTKYTTAPSRTDRTDVSTTSNQSGTTTEEPLPDDKRKLLLNLGVFLRLFQVEITCFETHKISIPCMENR